MVDKNWVKGVIDNIPPVEDMLQEQVEHQRSLANLYDQLDELSKAFEEQKQEIAHMRGTLTVYETNLDRQRKSIVALMGEIVLLRNETEGA